MSLSIQSDGWLRTSLVAILRRRVVITFLPLLSSSTRVSARDGVDEEDGDFWGEVSGEGVDWVLSGDEVGSDEVGLGNQLGVTKRPSKG